jgi:hypothetical protein
MSVLPYPRPKVATKPRGVSYFLFIKDLIKGDDPRVKSPKVDYLCSRIENLKSHLKTKEGLRFDEDAKAWGVYAYYKPYILIDDEENMRLAHALLEKFGTIEVLNFLGLNSLEDES